MHIIIAIISAAAGLIWAINSLQQSGFRLSSLNPFYWHRRTKWRKQYAENPLYSLENPMDVAAALFLGIAKLEGEVSREQKSEILNIFNNKFSLNDKDAQDLFSATSFLLQPETNFVANIDKILENSKDKFLPQQVESTLQLLNQIATLDGEMTDLQNKVINSVRKILAAENSNAQSWN